MSQIVQFVFSLKQYQDYEKNRFKMMGQEISMASLTFCTLLLFFLTSSSFLFCKGHLSVHNGFNYMIAGLPVY